MSKDEPIPSVIPKVEWIDGEPVIAREHVVRPSPVPRSLAIILVLLAALSLGYTFYEQGQREDQFQAQRTADEADDRRVEGLVEDLQRQQERANMERERLRLLVLGILAADSPEDRAELLRIFAEETATENDANAQQDSDDPLGEPSTNDQGVTEPSSMSEPKPAPRPSRQPRPSPSPSPSEEPPVVDAPPVPLVPEQCFDSPLGKLCT